MSACLSVCRTVSTEAMQVLMGSLPWELECIRRDVRYKLKNGVAMNEWDIVSNQEVSERKMEECMRLVNARLYER